MVQTQAEVDALAGVRKVEGSLSIDGTRWEGPTHLGALSCLTEVTGSLLVTTASELPSLSGLEHLTRVGNVEVVAAYSLASLTGLERLREVSGDLRIDGNDRLPTLAGLERLSAVGGNVKVSGNLVLKSRAGLEASLRSAATSN
jgi:hypothetical protein